ncbi:MAG: MazG family protein [Mycobacteriales bacterium]
MAGRLVLVAVSPRVPPGLLSWPAWEALRAGPVLTGDAGSPQLPFLRDAGVEVEVVERTSGLAGELHDRAVGGGSLVWLATGPADAELIRALGLHAAASGQVTVEQVPGSYDPPGARLLDVVAVLDRLRSPGGCPWDAEQTHESLKPYLLEEAYEAYQALEDGNAADLREELGDVLLQVAFHARLAQEGEPAWSIDDVAGDLVDKLVRRHPHVFAGASADDLDASWEALKKAEKGRASVTEGVPLSQPALALAAKLQKRATRLGVPARSVGGSGNRIGPGNHGGLGDQLWALVARCREAGLEPEAELRAVARGFRDRLAAVEASVRAEGREPADLSASEWERRLS